MESKDGGCVRRKRFMKEVLENVSEVQMKGVLASVS